MNWLLQTLTLGFLTGYSLAGLALISGHESVFADSNPAGFHQDYRLPWANDTGERRAGGCATFATGCSSTHTGYTVDISSLDGPNQGANDPIKAMRRGTVQYIPFAGSCGNQVRITDPSGRLNQYCHLNSLSNIEVLGQYANQGEHLGISGETGLEPPGGDHLHFTAGNSFNIPFGPGLTIQHLSDQPTTNHSSDNMGVGYTGGQDNFPNGNGGIVANAVAAAFFSFGLDYGSTYGNFQGGACNITNRQFAECTGTSGTQDFVVTFGSALLPSSATRGQGASDVHRINGRIWWVYDRTITSATCNGLQVYRCMGRPTSTDYQWAVNIRKQDFAFGTILRFDDGTCRVQVRNASSLIQEFIICDPFI